MSEGYQAQDAPHFDYGMQSIQGVDEHRFRGPVPDLDQPYIACIGGAQTMGRFCRDPYPARLQRALGLPCLNLGLGGAGPRFALHPQILPLLQGARLVVVQTFSGRSASNSLYDNAPHGRNSGRCVRTGAHVFFEQFLEDLMLREDEDLLRRTLDETREDFAHTMTALGNAIGRPSVLLWLSRRTPDYAAGFGSVFEMGSHYPQLIDAATLEACRPAFDAYVECAEPLGLPQKLWRGEPVEATRTDDEGTLWNHYYPSPEMHDHAASLLVPRCRELLAGS